MIVVKNRTMVPYNDKKEVNPEIKREKELGKSSNNQSFEFELRETFCWSLVDRSEPQRHLRRSSRRETTL